MLKMGPGRGKILKAYESIRVGLSAGHAVYGFGFGLMMTRVKSLRFAFSA